MPDLDLGFLPLLHGYLTLLNPLWFTLCTNAKLIFWKVMTLIKWNCSHPGMVLGFQDLGSNSISTLSSFWSLPVRYNQLISWMFSENGCTFIQIISRIKFFLLWYVICCCSVAQSCLTLCDPMGYSTACQASLSFTISQNLLKLVPIESVIPSIHLILCHPLLLWPSIFPSISILSNESALCFRWPKYWSFSFSISPSNEYHFVE